LLEACTAKDKTVCDAFIRQTINERAEAACFKGMPAEDVRADVVHELRSNERQANGANAGHAADLVAGLLANECSSAE
jgi:hypothetical protein